MNLLAIKNLTARETFEVEPWELNLRRPDFSTKADMLRWAVDRNTDWCFISGWEGINPHFRVSRENEGLLLRALVVDYDVPQNDQEAIQMMLSKAKYRPSWICRSFSSAVHVVFELEKPVHVFNSEVREKFLKNLKKILALGSLFPGLDEKFLFDCQTYLEVGSEWTKVEGAKPLPSSIVTDALAKAVEKSKFLSRENPVIPLEVIEKEVHERWPGRWTGPFVEGARGVRFWDPTADAMSAVVKQTGMVCYTGTEGFMSWRRLFGDKFVEEYEANRTAGAIEEIYWDGREYWKKGLDDKWFSMRKDDLIIQMKVCHGLSSISAGGSPSETEKAIVQIQEMNRIDAAIPFLCRPVGIILKNGERFLNICGTAVLRPADLSSVDEEHFPWIANFLDSFFDPKEQLDYFLSWLKRFYEGCLTREPKQGHTLFLAGDVNQGKTLLSNILISEMVGGHADAAHFLMGETSFNKELFHKNLWTMDDNTPASDPKRQARYTAIVKKMAANQCFQYHPKFKDPVMVEWTGRVVVTCNIDPESIRILPDLDASVAEKVSALRIRTATSLERGFTGDHVTILRRELPAFCRWLLEWEYPEYCLGDPRYGVKNYLQKDLEESAVDSSESTQFHELVEMFLKTHLSGNPGKTEWKGTASELHKDMCADAFIEKLAMKLSSIGVGRMLRKLKNQRPDLVSFRRIMGFREWTIKPMSSVVGCQVKEVS